MEFRDFWYVVAESRQLKPGKVLARKVLGEWLAVFRDEDGKPVALQDRCKHRAFQLSEGTVSKGQVMCPYHGWTYDKEGQVVGVPSEGENFKRAKSRCVPRYSTCESDDYVYVRLSDGEHAQDKPFAIQHYKEKGWNTIRVINRFNNTVTNCVENFIDIPHTVYVHPGIFRNERRELIDVRIERVNGSVKATYRNETDNLGWTSKFFNPDGVEAVHTDEFFMPNVTCVEYIYSPKRRFLITSQSIPWEDDDTLVYTDVTFNYGALNFLAAPFVRWMGQRIISQDVEAMAKQMKCIKKYGEDFSNTPADTIHAYVETIQRELARGNDPRDLPDKVVDVQMLI
ncbi:MAG: aromatic ring-hydroxylating dioxygenase subunit alpha [Myxococcota bacterium]|nr:aromatic ring-hydroxylating dioxygenase subunit alpha [Myxococcota bacterium]